MQPASPLVVSNLVNIISADFFKIGFNHYAELNYFAQSGVWGAAFGTGVLTALLSSIMNNVPTVLVGALSIDTTRCDRCDQGGNDLCHVIGSDLGPKTTPIGSLATLLWLHVLVRKGMTITWSYYVKVGTIPTFSVLAVTLAALALRLSLAG